MASTLDECRGLSDRVLLENLDRLRAQERHNLADIIAHLAEIERRELFARQGFPSFFVFCVSHLGYSEAEAGWRLYCVHAVRRFPAILAAMETDGIPLTSVITLAPHMTEENHLDLLRRAKGKGKFEIQQIVAELAPREDSRDVIMTVASSMEKVPSSTPASGHGETSSSSAVPRSIDRVEPTAPERVRVAFNGSLELLGLLRRAQDILRHKYPGGDLEGIFQEALEALLDKKDPERRIKAKEGKLPAAREPSTWAFASRHIPQAVQDAVYRRDEGRCAYRAPDGRRCGETGSLEFDHIQPFALGGTSNDPANIRLLCRTHNRLLARDLFGTVID